MWVLPNPKVVRCTTKCVRQLEHKCMQKIQVGAHKPHLHFLYSQVKRAKKQISMNEIQIDQTSVVRVKNGDLFS